MRKIILIVSIIVVLLVVFFIVYNKMKKDSENAGDNDTNTVSSNHVNGVPDIDNTNVTTVSLSKEKPLPDDTTTEPATIPRQDGTALKTEDI